MATKPKLKFKFSFTRKGAPRVWSTSFYLDTPVADLTAFENLVDAMVSGTGEVLENCFYSDVTIVGCGYYAAGSDIATYEKPLSQAGVISSSGVECPSDAVSLWRFATTARTSKNHPIYLFNFMHGVRSSSSSGHGDIIDGTQGTNQQTVATRFVTGWTVGGVTYKRCGPNGAVAQSADVESYITHRDFRK